MTAASIYSSKSFASHLHIRKIPNVVMVGPGVEMKGGISSVEREYLNGGLGRKINLVMLVTYGSGNIFRKMMIFTKAICEGFPLFAKTPEVIVHIHVSQKGSFIRKSLIVFMAKIFSRKVIMHLHGSEFLKFMNSSFLMQRLVKIVFNQSDAVIVLNDEWKKILSEFLNHKNIMTLYNPSRVQGNKRKRSSEVRVLFLGRIGERKGVFEFLKGLKRFSEDYRKLQNKFVFAGDGEVERARQYIRENQLEDLVEIPGWISGTDKAQLLESADILLLPSQNEQMPMSILEAMSYGLPIVSTRVAGIPEMVDNGVNGYLFEPQDVDGMCQAIKKISQDSLLRDKMGACSQEIIKTKFETDIILTQLVRIYENLQK